LLASNCRRTRLNGIGMSDEIKIVHEEAGTDKKLAIQGRINVSTSDGMRRALADALHMKPPKLSVDLSAVSYIDSSGVATLIEASGIARKQGTRLILAGIHDQPLYFFEITHLDQLFDIAGQGAGT
jgi:anti-sigma B factor antagonist